MIKFLKHKYKVPEITQEEAEEIRNDLRGRRICVYNRRLFAARLENIKKHGYTLIEDATEEQLNYPINSRLVNDFKTINAVLESEENEIKR